MRNSWSKFMFVVVVSFLVAMMLDVLPLPHWALWLRPHWVIMVLLFWNLATPQRIGVGSAWFLGLLVDVLYNSTLGEHALLFTLLSYVVIKLQSRLHLVDYWQQIFMILPMMFLYQLGMFIVRYMVGSAPHTVLFWLPLITSVMFWPWVYSVLSGITAKLNRR